MADRQRRRELKEVWGTPRSAAGSLWRSVRPTTPPRSRWEFLTSHVWPWLVNYLRFVFRPRQPFPVYAVPPSAHPGVHSLPETCVVALAGDWGTGTDSALRVATQIRGHAPDVTIHLGDVYYSGTAEEYEAYFLGAEGWPRGRLGTYALNGNHEMYSGGEGYFGRALPRLEQPTSYFCLENRHWRIVAVDTGYYSRTFPFLELLLRNWIRLHPANRRWLREVVFADPDDRRPVILLSHHQWFSAFEAGYPRVGANLAPYLDRVGLWFWGHEHRFAAYGPYTPGGTPLIRARCIGHGGMPIEVRQLPDRTGPNLVCVDERRLPRPIDGEAIGYCGFALLRFDGPTLDVSYVDEHGTKLLEERWVRDGAGVVGSVVYGSPGLTIARGKELVDLVAS